LHKWLLNAAFVVLGLGILLLWLPVRTSLYGTSGAISGILGGDGYGGIVFPLSLSRHIGSTSFVMTTLFIVASAVGSLWYRALRASDARISDPGDGDLPV